ncbi:MAG: PAS domain S-box protein, partial [Planctomycetes bacterium]|nr:PAS domain S-box protein [Planctomycetota bacterium]
MSDPLRAREPAGTRPEAPEAFLDPAFLRVALQRAPEGICIARVAPPSPEVRFLLWNRRMEEITGFDVEELRRRGGIPALLPDPAMRERAEAVSVELLRGRDVVEDEWEIQRPDGGLRRVAFAAMVLKREAGDFEILTFMKEITEARRAEEALRGSEEFLRDVFDTIQDGLSVLDRDLNIVRVNRWMERMYAHAAPIAGRKCFAVYHGRTAVCEVCPTVIAVRTGETCTRQVPYTTDRGPVGWLDLTAFPLKDADGRVTGVIEHVKDITDRARAEKALRESEEKYGSLFRQSRDGIVLHDLETDVFEANPRILEMLGLAPGAGKPPFDAGVFTPSTGAAFQRAMQTVLERGVAVFETEFRRRDGSLLPAEVTAQLMEIGGRRHIQAIVRDLTERRKAEEERLRLEAQVQHVQKLESLGILAGGIAHDFNNLLMGVLGNADLALQEMSAVAPGRAFLLEIEKAARRAADLCRQMLAYSGKGRFVVEAVDLSELVEEMAHLLQVSVSKKAVLRYHFARSLPPVMADATQIRQVVMNLITNASEAVGDRSGVISLATGVMECDRNYFRGSVLDE